MHDDLVITQVKNFYATQKHSQRQVSNSALPRISALQAAAGKTSAEAAAHRCALQKFMNGERVEYQGTLRVVEVEGSRFPHDRYPHVARSPVRSP